MSVLQQIETPFLLGLPMSNSDGISISRDLVYTVDEFSSDEFRQKTNILVHEASRIYLGIEVAQNYSVIMSCFWKCSLRNLPRNTA